MFDASVEAILGYHAEEVVGKATPLLFYGHDEVVAAAAALSETLGYRVEANFRALVCRARGGETADEREVQLLRKDGRCVITHLAVTVMRDAEGQITGYLGTVVDVPQKKRRRRNSI